MLVLIVRPPIVPSGQLLGSCPANVFEEVIQSSIRGTWTINAVTDKWNPGEKALVRLRVPAQTVDATLA
jgi:hypothetical protein